MKGKSDLKISYKRKVMIFRAKEKKLFIYEAFKEKFPLNDAK